MSISRRRFGALLTICAVVAALAAVVASPAMAEIKQAKFSGSTIKLTTTGITAKLNGKEPKTCTLLGSQTISEISEGTHAWLFNDFLSHQFTEFNCPSSTWLTLFWKTSPQYNTVTGKYLFPVDSSESMWELSSPWGSYAPAWENFATGTWVNGSGSNQSKITFENARLDAGGMNLTISGTFTATTLEGKLLTLSH